MSKEPRSSEIPANPAAPPAQGETVAFDSVPGEGQKTTHSNDHADPPRKPDAKTSAPTSGKAGATVAPGTGSAQSTNLPAVGGATSVAGQRNPGVQQRAANVLGKYKLLKKLGQGGMGSVYKAQEIGREEVVAIKVLAKELSGKPTFVQRFQREARVMTALNHPNILRCFGAGEASGFHYLAVEYIDGGSVEDRLKQLGKFAIGDALYLILACARGLHQAHEQGMVHRDIKPDNILLTRTGEVKVADLGLAKQLDEDLDLTRTGTGAGTPIYMAPEQARDVKHIDRRCDIYSVGCMLYTFLAGQAPFQGATLVDLISAKEKGKFSPIRRFNDEVPERIDLIVDKMLAVKPEHRYASLAEVIRDLEALGMANEHLSFLETAPTAPVSESAATPVPVPTHATQQPVARGGTQPPTPRISTLAPQIPAGHVPSPDIWFWSLTLNGREIVKKVTTQEIRTLIKGHGIDAQAQVGKDPKKGFRALGTYPEFAGMLRSQQTQDKVEKKGLKTSDKFKELEAADARRRRWKWLKNLVGGAGNTIVGLLWIGFLLTLLGVGGYFFYMHFLR